MTNSELVVGLGIEGGGAAIYRTPHLSGGYQFHVEGSSMRLDDNDDENWRHWTTEPVETIQEAMRSIDKDGLWVLFHPISIHSEYRNAVWRQVQEVVRTLSHEHASMWKQQSPEWQRMCLAKEC